MRLLKLNPICISLLLCSLCSGAARPNILYLYVDDLGWGSIGPNGQAERKASGQPYVLTPNLDRLAEDGINFRRGYGCTVCSPARSSQQIGLHQGYTFADRNDPDNTKKAIRRDDLTMGDVLSKAGYTTGYWGKWGYGGSKDMDNPTIDNVQTLPTSHGYKYVVAELHHVRAHTFFQPTLWNAPSRGWTPGFVELKPNSMAAYLNNESYSNYPAFQNHPEYPSPAYCDDVYAFACLDFVREQAKEYNRSGTPFFGLFAAQIPHAPFKEVEKLPNWDHDYKDKSFFDKLSPQSKQWCAMVTRIDAHFGNILKALDDPNGDGDKSDSVAENTLVVFQSDNGGPRGSNREELDANGGLQGSKGSIYEGGIRVPTVMRWPAKITESSKLKAGSNSDMVVDCTDLLPTFCDLAGASIPVGLSGVSLAPTLRGKGVQRTREFLIHEAGGQASIISGKHKLIRSRASNKKRNKASETVQLFDLDADPAEKNNLAKKHPELMKELSVLLKGERVDEPAGFANTYHQWKGGPDADIAKATSWTNYIYENAGITYMKEDGSPKSNWTATIKRGTAVASQDTEFLGLEISGRLKVNSNVTVHARNELRVAKNGRLVLQDGQVFSMRWLDVQEGGVLAGHGTVASDLYVQGELSLGVAQPLVVKGDVTISGTLSLASSGKIKLGQEYIVLRADSISGRFNQKSVSLGGKEYAIKYSDSEVSLASK